MVRREMWPWPRSLPSGSRGWWRARTILRIPLIARNVDGLGRVKVGLLLPIPIPIPNPIPILILITAAADDMAQTPGPSSRDYLLLLSESSIWTLT